MEERLRKFARLVDTGSFTKASETLHISQPALSSAIAKLERELKAQLLIRRPRSFRLTEAGQAAYKAAKDLRIQNSNLITRIADISGKPAPVAIGMIDSVANAFFESAAGIRGLENQTRTSVIVNNSRYLNRAVEKDELDVAFVTEQPLSSPLLDAAYIASEPLLLICRPNLVKHVEAGIIKGSVTGFISYDPASTSYSLIKSALGAKKLDTTGSFSSTSPEVMLRMVLLGKGSAVLPYLLVKKHIENGGLTAPNRSGRPVIIERRINAVARRKKILSQPMEEASARIRQLLESQNQDIARTVGYNS